MGGVKVLDKIVVIERLMDVVDGFIIGGVMVYIFLKGMGKLVGKFLVENDKLRYVKEMIEWIEVCDKIIFLLVDYVVFFVFNDIVNVYIMKDVVISENEMGLDIGL